MHGEKKKKTKPEGSMAAANWCIHPILLQGSTYSVDAVQNAAHQFVQTEVCSKIREALLNFAIGQIPAGTTLSDEVVDRHTELLQQMFTAIDTETETMYTQFVSAISATQKTQPNKSYVPTRQRPTRPATSPPAAPQGLSPENHLMMLHLAQQHAQKKKGGGG